MMQLQGWYRPGEIRFSRRQVIWILSHLSLLKEGLYPSPPHDSGYEDTPIGRNSRRVRGAVFERACDIATEVDIRLKKTGLDGLIAEAFYCWGKTETDLALVFGLTPENISRKLKSVLGYISGWRRKQYCYRDYIAHKKVVKHDVGK